MGRMNRSRKRKAEMDRIKKERNAKKELLRLKKTLGLVDENGKEILEKMEEVIEYKTPEQLKRVNWTQYSEIILFVSWFLCLIVRKRRRRRSKKYWRSWKRKLIPVKRSKWSMRTPRRFTSTTRKRCEISMEHCHRGRDLGTQSAKFVGKITPWRSSSIKRGWINLCRSRWNVHD